MEKKWYDFFAWCGRIGLGALAVFYATVGKTWNLPYTEQIPATLTALAVLINSWLGIDSKKYWAEHNITKADEEDA